MLFLQKTPPHNREQKARKNGRKSSEKEQTREDSITSRVAF
jgi:hypothetical protein